MTSPRPPARDETGVFRDCPGKYPRGEEDGNGRRRLFLTAIDQAGQTRSGQGSRTVVFVKPP